MHKPILSSLVLLGMLLFIATTPYASAFSQADRAVNTQSLSRYLPAPNQYPAGYNVLHTLSYKQPSLLFFGANADLATRLHFVTGASQTSFGPNVVVLITVARFRNQLAARHFRIGFRSDVLTNAKQSSGVVNNLGSTGGQYETGGCASCGPTAPTVSQLFFARGAVFVGLRVQPSNLALARQLGKLIDAKLKRALVR
ncbi:MAG: hypothetical protein NVSMB52_10680 [Chloroflexota bacterium]